MSQSKTSGRKSVAGMGSIRKKEKVVNGKAYIHKNPTAGCKLPKVVRPEIKPLEPEEIARML